MNIIAQLALVLRKVLVRDVRKRRPVEMDPNLLTSHPEEVLAHPQVDTVIELVGGEYPATQYIKQALANGKHVVTANKEVMAKHGYELFSLARKRNTDIRYEASVGSGIPLISTFQQDLAAISISAIHAIVNGTTNYILTRMAHEELDFASRLEQAQKLGFAEADPANDIEGIDASYKLVILSNLAFGTKFTPRDVYCEGISTIAARDFSYAREFGYAIKPFPADEGIIVLVAFQYVISKTTIQVIVSAVADQNVIAVITAYCVVTLMTEHGIVSSKGDYHICVVSADDGVTIFCSHARCQYSVAQQTTGIFRWAFYFRGVTD